MMRECKIMYNELYDKPILEVLKSGDEIYFLFDGKLSYANKKFYKGTIKTPTDIGVVVEFIAESEKIVKKHFVDKALIYIKKKVKI